MSEMEKQPEKSPAAPAEQSTASADKKKVRMIVDLVVLAVALVAVCVIGEIRKPAWWCYLRGNLGSADMQFELGKHYANSETPDLQKAEKWLAKAVANGHKEAVSVLAKVEYDLGRGCFGNGDHAAAFKWYEKAAGRGMPEAQHALGGCYRRGEGVKADPEKAKEWYKKAVAQGYGPSEAMLENMASENK